MTKVEKIKHQLDTLTPEAIDVIESMIVFLKSNSYGGQSIPPNSNVSNDEFDNASEFFISKNKEAYEVLAE